MNRVQGAALAHREEPADAAAMAAGLASCVRDAGCKAVFGLPGGGTNLEVIGAAESVGLPFVLAHGETSTAIMAAVFGELTGGLGVALTTRGPGVASAVNGAANATLDGRPLLLVTDCVPRAARPRVTHQFLDQTTLLRPVTKASIVYGAAGGDEALRHAVSAATSGRPGAVHLDFDATAAQSRWASRREPNRPSDLAKARSAIAASRRPVVVAGLGAIRHSDALRRFVEDSGVPVLTTYRAKGVVADSSPNAAGLITGGVLEAALLGDADLAIGVGFDPVELIPSPAWPYDTPLVLLGDWLIEDTSLLRRHLVAEVAGDLKELLALLRPELRPLWGHEEPQRARQAAVDALLHAGSRSVSGLAPQDVMRICTEVAPADSLATVDAGAHMLVAMPLWEVASPGGIQISSGLATMGFSLPAAIGAALACPGRQVLCFTGDGGLGMALAELETLGRLQLAVTVIVFNDSLLSLIAAKQRSVGHGGAGAVRYSSTSFARVAEGLGLSAHSVATAADYESSLESSLRQSGPTLIDVAVDPTVYPDILKAARG